MYPMLSVTSKSLFSVLQRYPYDIYFNECCPFYGLKVSALDSSSAAAHKCTWFCAHITSSERWPCTVNNSLHIFFAIRFILCVRQTLVSSLSVNYSSCLLAIVLELTGTNLADASAYSQV